MSVTITLNDDLVLRLQAQAQARCLSLEQWALTVLDQATAGSQELQTWSALNRRRAELIRRRYTGGLSEAEDRELAELQAAVDRTLEPWDQELSKRLALYETQTEQLSHIDD
jgi:hypothetical protein